MQILAAPERSGRRLHHAGPSSQALPVSLRAPLHGLYATTVDGKPAIVERDPDPELRDTEQVPLLEDGGIEAFIRREVLPYTADAWVKSDATKVGTLEEISADILAIEREAEGLLDGLLVGEARS